MAGVVPKRASSGRKQWTLHDGPSSSRSRLRYQLATDGCPESQVVLAKQLLDEPCQAEPEMRENERLGVYWLIKASQQGNGEATELLKKCHESGKGITELNCLDVKACITMSQDEKIARRAAREVFARLSNGGEFITSDQLQRKLLALEKAPLKLNGRANGEICYESERESDEEDEWSIKSDSSTSNNEKLTEDNLVSAAVDYSHGVLPQVNSLCLSAPPIDALDNVPLLQRSILHPQMALVIFYHKLIQFGRNCFRFFNQTNLQLLILTIGYCLLSFENVAYLVPLLAFYGSLLVMLVTTCQMLNEKREFYEFRLWSGLFICYSNGDLNSEQVEYQYILNNLRPYALFFGAFLCNSLIYPIIAEQFIPQSELMIVSFLLMFTTLIGFMYRKRGKKHFDLIVLFSFGLNILAKYPYELDLVVAQGWRFADLKVPTFASYILGNGVDCCINFRTGFYFFIPIVLLKLAAKQSWKGTYKLLVPHCVTLSWLQVCITTAQGATMFGLLRGSLALAGLVFFAPIVGLTSVFLPAIALTKWLIQSNVVFGGCLFLAIAGAILWTVYKLAKSKFRRFGVFVQICTTVGAIVVILRAGDLKFDIFDDQMAEYLPWDVYQRFCHQPVWQEENMAVAQVKCASLHEVRVSWEGFVSEVRVQAIENRYGRLFDRLPTPIRRFLYCLFGEQRRNDCDRFSAHVQEECFTFHNSIKSLNRCTLERYDVYSFGVTFRMSSGIWGKGPEVVAVLGDQFRNFSLGLKPNDQVWFKGRLMNSEAVLGGARTFVGVDEVGCLACTNRSLMPVRRKDGAAISFANVGECLIVGFKFVLNIIFNPVVVFK